MSCLRTFRLLPSVCNPCPARKVDDRLNKLYSRFNTGPQRGHQDSRQSRDKSTSRSRSRSTSRSRNNSSSSRSNNNNNNINTSRPNVSNCKNQSNNNNTNSRNNANSSGSTQSSHTLRPNDTTSTSPNNHPNCTLPQHIIDELKAWIEKIAHTLNTLEETVSWMNDTITAHEYKLSELKSMMNYDNPGDSDLYPPCDDPEIQENSYNRGWDDIPAQDTNSGFNLPPHTSPSIMDTSPDASFSALNPNSVLSRRHVLLLNSRHNIITPDATTSRLQLEISNVTNVQKNLSTQLGSIIEKLDSFSPSKPSPSND
ncbi:hypothetical protein RirG_172520 [Rhizophagus irregularis DAOM 197198w]|uniref:Uncharacterized protein n=1 Tax=Rhizophagus irregularis (strain DAOM 197198w) TaxID=1432141 RepID=A0A015KNE3_RHIIW|nr:hypothetical protein RirG_172520 [Rhizophagus irregularis DAOM 197198w]